MFMFVEDSIFHSVSGAAISVEDKGSTGTGTLAISGVSFDLCAIDIELAYVGACEGSAIITSLIGNLMPDPVYVLSVC